MALNIGNLFRIPKSVGHIHTPLGAVFLIGLHLVGRIAFFRSEHIDALQNITNSRGAVLSDYRKRHEARQRHCYYVMLLHRKRLVLSLDVCGIILI